MLLLGIETSCDDTATAVVRDGVHVLSNVSTNQDEFHAKYGGIVPEIASRRHAALLSAAIDDALARAGVPLCGLDGIAVTAGPGLIGSLVVGVAAAKALAFATDLPLYAVNHLHGHLFAAFLERDRRIDLDQLRVAARDQQREERVLRRLLALEKGGEQMAVQMVDRVQRQVGGERERLSLI